MNNEKTWSDQPSAVVSGTETISTFTIRTPEGSVSVEVRRVDYEEFYFVTAGNLFGSQTVKAADHRAAFALFQRLSEGNDKLPRGCELVE